VGSNERGGIGAVDISTLKTEAKEALVPSHGWPLAALRVEVEGHHARTGRSEVAGSRAGEGRLTVALIAAGGGERLRQEVPGGVDAAVAVAITVAVVDAVEEDVAVVPVHAASSELEPRRRG